MGCVKITSLATYAFNAIMPLSRASTRGRYSRIEGVAIPSALRENYSLLVMESTGMMKIATGEGFPLRQGARMGLDWLSVATEASGGGTPDLFCSPIVLGYMEIYRRKKYVRGPRGAHEGGGRTQGVGAPPAS